MATIINTRNPWVPDAPTHRELREVYMVFETMGPNVLALIKRSGLKRGLARFVDVLQVDLKVGAEHWDIYTQLTQS